LFPTLSNIDASLYRRRAINYPKLPTTINEISLNGSWKLDKNGADFLLVDETWNANNDILNDLSRTNNHVEGYNSRLDSIFPLHPHIFEFVELLRDEHVYQHHQAEESDIQTGKRKKSML
ncbi:unnamed protein product, partial [Didymodactylos carnosus]